SGVASTAARTRPGPSIPPAPRPRCAQPAWSPGGNRRPSGTATAGALAFARSYLDAIADSSDDLGYGVGDRDAVLLGAVPVPERHRARRDVGVSRQQHEGELLL